MLIGNRSNLARMVKQTGDEIATNLRELVASRGIVEGIFIPFE